MEPRLRILVTGSSGHLGEALVRVLSERGHHVVGLDITQSPTTTHVGSVVDRRAVRDAVQGCDAVVHTATLHKPHVVSHTKEDFVSTNVTGSLVVAEESVAAGVGRFVFTSSTTTFGRAMTPSSDAPASWITEDVVPVPRNIYGVTKTAAEDICRLVHQDHGLPVVVLRIARFFPEADGRSDIARRFDDRNVKTNELLYRRVDIADAVDAHERALFAAPRLGFGRYIVSATTPFDQADRVDLRADAPSVVSRRYPDFQRIYDSLGWTMFTGLDRVYVNSAARRDLEWVPKFDFGYALRQLAEGRQPFSELTVSIGRKGYHDRPTGPYTL
ncbi:NAD-dependent epimerase/dehydratase family protein [Rhodococcus sp. NPDC057297]|uniref:NAD-dependent epimerase/dehydratase family protein n=1 Tax=Rhodococcus sp. NPDC057297 TaxID=3346090 RepID=UPI00363EFCF7